MKLQRLALALAGAGLFAVTAVSGSAVAAGSADPKPSVKTKVAQAKQGASVKSAAAAECASWVGWVRADGSVTASDISPAKPPASDPWENFQFVGVRASGTFYLNENAAQTQLYYYGLFLQGGNLYRHTTTINMNTNVHTPVATKVGSGWTSFKTIATSNYTLMKPRHSYLYGLNANGSLYRYSQVGTAFKSLGSFAGFKSFKAMTVVSETATYDTLLMTTKAGALYTVRIPVTATAKPVLKLVRSTGFAAYEGLTAHGCGVKGGSLIVGVDHDTDSGDQYAFSKFNGAATAMTAYGKIPQVFDGTATAPFTTYWHQLVGE
ncbi:hypothetical protein [Streptomyces sp. SID13031]|uniref:hypothetical protein n=1 Tax=Streptomyces sp. SID13031 TaxID=2706046 RepID=UPI0013C81C02|nr:hypothetical protein [Streptomyces sp. SID13031]NEA34122.1 hypothetical protein [Streptomyces sp. SID13031]